MPAPTTEAKPVAATARPSNLPPPLAGEEKVDGDLVLLVRDGGRRLEDEDYLVQEIAHIYGAYELWNEPVHWTPPIPEGEAVAMGDERLIGHEIKFNALTGNPVAFTLVAAMDHKEPLYTKKIPTRTWPVLKFPCPLTSLSPKTVEYQAQGFPVCSADRFVNFAVWERHVRERHPAFLVSMEAISAEKPLPSLWKEAMAQGDKLLAARRASDPRLAEAAVAV